MALKMLREIKLDLRRCNKRPRYDALGSRHPQQCLHNEERGEEQLCRTTRGTNAIGVAKVDSTQNLKFKI